MTKKIEVLRVEGDPYNETVDLYWAVRNDWVEYSPKQARKLAKRLIEAADEAENE